MMILHHFNNTLETVYSFETAAGTMIKKDNLYFISD